MNRYRSGGPSKASSTTLCQKCLKRGHYSYECTASQQDRPYISRPSRSQQLLNPKLAPKLSAPVPDSKPETKKSASSRDASQARERGRDELRDPESPKRRRSFSLHSSDSVSTISTNQSRSRSPPSRHRSSYGRREDRSQSAGRDSRRSSRKERTARRSHEGEHRRRRSPSRERRRSTSGSPGRRGARSNLERSRSRSPYKASGPGSRRERDDDRRAERNVEKEEPSQARERSLSPYSRRVAMSRNMNNGM